MRIFDDHLNEGIIQNYLLQVIIVPYRVILTLMSRLVIPVTSGWRALFFQQKGRYLQKLSSFSSNISVLTTLFN